MLVRPQAVRVVPTPLRGASKRSEYSIICSAVTESECRLSAYDLLLRQQAQASLLIMMCMPTLAVHATGSYAGVPFHQENSKDIFGLASSHHYVACAYCNVLADICVCRNTLGTIARSIVHRSMLRCQTQQQLSYKNSPVSYAQHSEHQRMSLQRALGRQCWSI